MFGINGTPQDMGSCSCENLKHGNRPQIKSTWSPGITAAIMGWGGYCEIPDYDKLAKEAAEGEKK